MENKDLKSVSSLTSVEVEILVAENLFVVCLHSDTNAVKNIKAQQLGSNFWLNKETQWSYFVSIETLNEIQKFIQSQRDEKEKVKQTSKHLSTLESSIKSSPKVDNMGDLYRQLKKKETSQIINEYGEANDTFKEIVSAGKPLAESSKIAADTINYGVTATKAVIDNFLSLEDDDAKLQSKELVHKTGQLVGSIRVMLKNTVAAKSIFNELLEKSNGLTINHMNRVFLYACSWLVYYRDEMNDFKLKKSYAENKKFYDLLLKKDTTFYDVGLGVIQNEADLTHWMSAVLTHDVGKLDDVEYHEGAGSFDFARASSHVFVGAKLLERKTVFSKEAIFVAGNHHIKYGFEGYGLLEKNRKFTWLISNNISDVESGRAYDFLLNRIVQIIDIYDAMTDPARKYKNAMSVSEAFDFMYKKMVVEKTEIDPVLFQSFRQLIESGWSEDADKLLKESVIKKG